MRGPVDDDRVHAELDGLGLRHFRDVRATVRRMLAHMRRPERTAFAAAVAERLMRQDERLPTGERRPHPATWRPAIDAVWHGLAGDGATPRGVATAVARFYLGPGYHGRRHDDPRDADDHAIMAAFYAAECALHGCLEFAIWAGWRGFDAATVHAAADPAWPHRRPAEVSPYGWELAHPAVQAELDQQLADLELLALEGPVLCDEGQQLRRPEIVERLRTGSDQAVAIR